MPRRASRRLSGLLGLARRAEPGRPAGHLRAGDRRPAAVTGLVATPVDAELVLHRASAAVRQPVVAERGRDAPLALALSGGGDKTTQPAAAPASGAPVNASFDTQIYNAKGLSVKVPKSWKKNTGGSYVDYVDPDDSKHKARILVENGSGSAESFLKVAENGLRKNKTSCPTP